MTGPLAPPVVGKEVLSQTWQESDSAILSCVTPGKLFNFSEPTYV